MATSTTTDSALQAFHLSPKVTQNGNAVEKRIAYVIGAGEVLGETVLNQLLGSTHYRTVRVATVAPLPGSIAHLSGFELGHLDQLLTQDISTKGMIDWVFIVGQGRSIEPSHSALSQLGKRQTVYAPLSVEQAPALLRSTAQMLVQPARCLLVSESSTAADMAQMLSTYSAHIACMVYGLEAGETSQVTYQFKPLGKSFLDRVGAGLLNFIVKTMGQVVNPKGRAPLTRVKIAQRLSQRFWAMVPTHAGLRVHTPEQLKAVI